MAWPGDWELRVLVDGEILLAERCPRGAEAFGVAELWMGRMLDQGWRQVVPGDHQLKYYRSPAVSLSAPVEASPSVIQLSKTN
jgi:hypothetical protein